MIASLIADRGRYHNGKCETILSMDERKSAASKNQFADAPDEPDKTGDQYRRDLEIGVAVSGAVKKSREHNDKDDPGDNCRRPIKAIAQLCQHGSATNSPPDADY
ncbi:MAG TPA: hypothetical protein VH206_07010 [Xanthobacteraceae bacterium]|nr:hypothetical protein [Xanthobacteraceae bacterium]